MRLHHLEQGVHAILSWPLSCSWREEQRTVIKAALGVLAALHPRCLEQAGHLVC